MDDVVDWRDRHPERSETREHTRWASERQNVEDARSGFVDLTVAAGLVDALDQETGHEGAVLTERVAYALHQVEEGEAGETEGPDGGIVDYPVDVPADADRTTLRLPMGKGVAMQLGETASRDDRFGNGRDLFERVLAHEALVVAGPHPRPVDPAADCPPAYRGILTRGPVVEVDDEADDRIVAGHQEWVEEVVAGRDPEASREAIEARLLDEVRDAVEETDGERTP